MDIKQQILHYYRIDELSLREVSRRTRADRKTVTRPINAYKTAVEENPETGIEEFLSAPEVLCPSEQLPRCQGLPGRCNI
ncbi:MAG: hypothetical protein IJ154_00140 [Bacteroidales bacterium]|nr:hypothetical protein [Bacteroidales bacterium]